MISFCYPLPIQELDDDYSNTMCYRSDTSVP